MHCSSLTGCSWDPTGVKLALSSENLIWFANVRPRYKASWKTASISDLFLITLHQFLPVGLLWPHGGVLLWESWTRRLPRSILWVKAGRVLLQAGPSTSSTGHGQRLLRYSESTGGYTWKGTSSCFRNVIEPIELPVMLGELLTSINVSFTLGGSEQWCCNPFNKCWTAFYLGSSWDPYY